MSPKKKRLSPDEIIRILKKNGFNLVGQRGSHQKWRNPETGKTVIVAYHKGKVIPMGTLNSIIQGSGLNPELFE